MAKFNLNRETLPKLVARVQAIRADTPRQWGKLDVTKALRHLIFTFEMSLGIQKIEDTSKPVARDLIYLLFFRLFTNWPKGKIKAPDFVTPPAKGDFNAEQTELLRIMEQFVDEFERNPGRAEVNPGLGKISLVKWSRVHGVHMDHHLRQFGA